MSKKGYSHWKKLVFPDGTVSSDYLVRLTPDYPYIIVKSKKRVIIRRDGVKQPQKEKNLKLYEVHPESSFMAMNDMKVIEFGKKTNDGFKMRYLLLKKFFPKFNFEEGLL